MCDDGLEARGVTLTVWQRHQTGDPVGREDTKDPSGPLAIARSSHLYSVVTLMADPASYTVKVTCLLFSMASAYTGLHRAVV